MENNLKRSINLYNVSKLINTMGNFVYPLITYILLKTLEIPDVYIGTLIMIITALKIPGYLLGGIVGDKFDYQKIAIFLPVLCGVLMLICNFSISNKILVVICLGLSKFFSGVSAPSSVKIMDGLTNKENKKEVFAQAYMATNIGMSVAALCGGYLFSISYSLIFILDGLTRILSGLILIFVDINKTEKEEIREKEITEKNGLFNHMAKNHIWEYILLTEFFIYIYSQYSYAIPLELDKLFAHKSENIYSIVLFVNCITVIASTPIVKQFSKKIKALTCIQISFVLLLLGFSMYFWNLNIVAIVISTMIWSLGEVLFGINELIYISDNVAKKYFARTVSIYDSLQNAITSLGPMINSLFILKIGLKYSWLSLGAVGLLGAFAMVIFQNRIKTPAQEEIVE